MIKKNQDNKNHKILFIDDENDIVSLFKDVLDDLLPSSTINTENCGRTAMERITKDPNYYDLVITDLRMPNGNGLKVVKLCNELNIKVIIHSSNYSSYHIHLKDKKFEAIDKPASGEMFGEKVIDCLAA